MERKKILRRLFAIAITFMVFTCNKVYAAYASLNVSSTSVTVGQSASFTVNITAASWNVTVSGGGTSDVISGMNMDGEIENTQRTYNIDTSRATTYTITISGDVSEWKDNCNPTTENCILTTNVSTTKVVTVNPASTPSTPPSNNNNNNSNTNTNTNTNTNSNTNTTNNNSSNNSSSNSSSNSNRTNGSSSSSSNNSTTNQENKKKPIEGKTEPDPDTGYIVVEVPDENQSDDNNTVSVVNNLDITKFEISGYNINFDKNVYKYEIDIDEGVNILIINVEGNNILSSGTGEIDITGKDQITVTISSGSESHDYIINLNRGKNTAATGVTPNDNGKSNSTLIFIIGGAIVALAGAGVGIFFIIKNKNKAKTSSAAAVPVEAPKDPIAASKEDADSVSVLTTLGTAPVASTTASTPIQTDSMVSAVAPPPALSSLTESSVQTTTESTVQTTTVSTPVVAVSETLDVPDDIVKPSAPVVSTTEAVVATTEPVASVTAPTVSSAPAITVNTNATVNTTATTQANN